MVTLRMDAKAQVQGSEEQERYPIVAKVKGTGRDGGLSVQLSGDGSGPVSARISGDPSTPLAVAVSPITVVPDVKAAAENLNIASIVDALTRLSSGAKVELSSPAPLAVALGRIPVDLTISVSSPSSEAVLKVEIKGTIGE